MKEKIEQIRENHLSAFAHALRIAVENIPEPLEKDITGLIMELYHDAPDFVLDSAIRVPVHIQYNLMGKHYPKSSAKELALFLFFSQYEDLTHESEQF